MCSFLCWLELEAKFYDHVYVYTHTTHTQTLCYFFFSLAPVSKRVVLKAGLFSSYLDFPDWVGYGTGVCRRGEQLGSYELKHGWGQCENTSPHYWLSLEAVCVSYSGGCNGRVRERLGELCIPHLLCLLRISVLAGEKWKEFFVTGVLTITR